MSTFAGIERPHKPDWEGFVANILRKGTPDRVFHIELFHDGEIRDAILERFSLVDDLDPADPWIAEKKYIALQRFCGFDYVNCGLVDMHFPVNSTAATDTAEGSFAREGGRSYTDEHKGPITNWKEFEQYPWPDPTKSDATRQLEWFQENLPDDMCIIGGLTGHFAEFLAWLMGYETLCFALYDDRDLVQAMADKILAFHKVELARILEYDRVKMAWGSDDMGFRSGTLISPDDTREFVLSGHKVLAKMSHDANCPYILHSCGKLDEIMDDLIDDVKIDGKHSYEDTIEDVRELKATWGQRMALLGGLDLDFLIRADEKAVRERVRSVLDVCQEGGGYCLGTGNSVANYINLDSYLAMVDEGMRYSW
jgi:uroporphyrinogen decarboxylase